MPEDASKASIVAEAAMTRKLSTTGNDDKSPMELDLDSFLDSHLTSDSDDDLSSVPRRTVDEILNDSDSSTSSSSSPPPSSTAPKAPHQQHHRSHSSQNDAASDKSAETLRPSEFDDKSVQSKSSSIYRARTADFSGDPFWRVSSSRPLPSLFGGVKPNAKPGAALAAAAAASRSVPTPHAAAIKSRRSGIAGLHKVLESGESGFTVGDDAETVSDGLVSSNGDSFGAGSAIGRSPEKLADDERRDDFFLPAVDIGTELSRNDEISDLRLDDAVASNSGKMEMEERNDSLKEDLRISITDDELAETSKPVSNLNCETQVDSSSSNFEEHLSLSASSPILASNAPENRNMHSTSVQDDASMNADGHSRESALSTHGSNQDLKMEDDLIEPTLETEVMKDAPVSKDNDGGIGGDDGNSSLSDITELVEERMGQLETEMISKRAEKKSRSSMKPLELAEELEKKQAYTGLHWEEGAAAQPMRLEGVRRGSTTLGYFDVYANNTITGTISSQAFRRDHGSAQVLAVHSNYIAVGMSKGVIVVVPSKHSAHHPDHMDSKMLMLGLYGDRSHAPVTSMCFNQQGDLLLAGYGDGHITVWDVQRSSAAKVITGEHTSPVVHTLFLGQDSQVTRQFKAVTGDSKGLVLLHSFSVVPLLNRFTIKTQCLLDGQRTGIVLSASPLLFDEVPGGAVLSSQGNAAGSTSGIGSMMGGVVGSDGGWKLFNEGSSMVEEGVVIFVTHQTALVIRLTPNLEVYAQLSKPDGVREGSMPYTAWKCVMQSRSSPAENTPAEAVERVSLLAIAWDRKVQVAKLVKSELKVYGKWSLDSPAIGVAWLDDQMLGVLTSTGQLFLFAKDGTVIHQTSFAVDGSVGDDLIAYHTNFINVYGNPEKAYHSSVALRGASIYILGPAHLVVLRLLPWKERIQVLRKAGDWMGALNMAMTLYDGQAHGVVDLPRTLDAVQEAIMPYLVELLLSYVDEVFSYISVACCNQIGKTEQGDDPKGKGDSVHSEIKEQFTRVGGVAVEFCVHIKRTDILFDEIFAKFVAVQHRDTFLELLEPYILKDMLGSLPPEIMQALVEYYSIKGWLQRVEQCVLHMNIASLDFNQVVRLCREHGLYGALVYLFNKGLDDFKAPLEELLVVLQNSGKESASALGYRMLVYLKYCFLGLAFPPGHGALPPSRLSSLRAELVHFLLEDSGARNSKAVSGISTSYLNLYHLLELDTEATLDVLHCAFIEDSNRESCDSAEGSKVAEEENNSVVETQNSLVQDTINAFVHILDMDLSQTDKSANSDDRSMERWPSKRDIGHLYEFIAYYVACRRSNVSKRVLTQILEYLTSENNLTVRSSTETIDTLKKKEKQLLALLEVVPDTDWDASYVLHLCEKAQYYQVCGLIHSIRCQYVSALDSYIKDVDEPVHAFAFINHTLMQLTDSKYATFHSAVISRLPELVELSRECAFFLVIDHFEKEKPRILAELHTHPKSLFLYLKTAIEAHLSGTLNFSYLAKDFTGEVSTERRVKDHSDRLNAYLTSISEFPKFLRTNPVDVTDEMIELYLELLCQYERNSVLKFLETFEGYRVEHCLRLCQDYQIIDASAFLLERVGDVGSALLLTLSGLIDKFIELETVVESIVSKVGSSSSAAVENFSTVLKLKEVNVIYEILHACIGLCQRNTPRLNPEESETLWFKLLDTFCEPLMDSYNDKTVPKEDHHLHMLAESLGSKEVEEACIIKWRISKSQGSIHILRKLFSQFIKEIVEGMIGYVRLPTIMSKLLSDNGSQEFGDFKLTILGMLGTYGFERRILDTAKSLIEDDTFYTMSILKKGASHGYAPRSLLCCICNCDFSKTSSSSIRVFNCGHATHLQCEFLDNDASTRSSSSGCPVCMPKKNSQRLRDKSVIPGNGLVNLLKPQQGQGTVTLHPHETDPENAYGIQQISRFEILSSLKKNQRSVQIENLPQLRLAPPAVYHEKVKKGVDFLTGESSSGLAKVEKSSKSRQIREPKSKGSSLRFPIKTSIFGREKMSK